MTGVQTCALPISRIGLAVNQGLHHAAAGDTNDVADDRIELDVGILQRLLDTLRMTGVFAPPRNNTLRQDLHLFHPLRVGFAGG